MPTYAITDFGFTIQLPIQLYARPAVIKALYPFRKQFLISYELLDNTLLIYFEKTQDDFDIKGSISEVLKEIDFQMIRYDTINSTKDIRKLLVARALYATCIEQSPATEAEVSSTVVGWEKDSKHIFESWDPDR